MVYTDYTDHALIYSCNDRKLDGTCKEGAVHAYILSRNTSLSEQATRHVNMLLEGVCVDPRDMVAVPSGMFAVLIDDYISLSINQSVNLSYRKLYFKKIYIYLSVYFYVSLCTCILLFYRIHLSFYISIYKSTYLPRSIHLVIF